MNNSHDDTIVHRELETDGEEPVAQIVEIVSELEEKPIENLTLGYKQIDHVLDHVFSNPPDPKAQIEVTFSYEGYRITVEQNGNAEFVKL